MSEVTSFDDIPLDILKGLTANRLNIPIDQFQQFREPDQTLLMVCVKILSETNDPDKQTQYQNLLDELLVDIHNNHGFEPLEEEIEE